MVTGNRKKSKRHRTRKPVSFTVPDKSALIKGGLLGFGVLGLAWASGAYSAGSILRNADPRRAIQIAGDQPNALSALADQALLGTGKKIGDPAAARRYALRAIHSQALSAAALRTLGLSIEARPGDGSAAAGRLMRLSDKVSRRDLGSQIWLIEDNVRLGKISGALLHYDIAMRVHTSSRPVLLPILYGAMEDPAIKRATAPYVRKDAPWFPELLIYATAPDRDPSNVVDAILLAQGLPDTPIYKRLARQMLEGLLKAGSADAARRLYLTFPGTSQKILTDPGFSALSINEEFAPITWDVAGSSTSGAEFEGNRAGDASLTMRAFSGSGQRGSVARKIQYLKPGSYGFTQTVQIAKASSASAADWELYCVNGEERTLIWRAPASPSNSAKAVAGPQIPQGGCGVQLLQLVLDGGTSQFGYELAVEKIGWATPSR